MESTGSPGHCCVDTVGVLVASTRKNDYTMVLRDGWRGDRFIPVLLYWPKETIRSPLDMSCSVCLFGLHWGCRMQLGLLTLSSVKQPKLIDPNAMGSFVTYQTKLAE